MKVLPQKNFKKPNYPGLKDVCKTTAVLALTTSTLVSISACNKGPDVVGDVTAATEIDYLGGEMEYIPTYIFNDNNDTINVDYLSSKDTTFELGLADGNTLVIEDPDCGIAVAKGITIAEIEADSELDQEFSTEKYDRYDSDVGNVYFIPVICEHYIMGDEIELAGDVVDTVEPGDFSFADVSVEKTVTVETLTTDDETCYELATGDRLCIMPDTYCIAYDVTLDEIEEDSQFYELFSKEDYCFYETNDRAIVIVAKTSSSYYVDGFELDGDVVAVIDEE